jgi:PTH2 family peptidyl-tRNA hydrolase
MRLGKIAAQSAHASLKVILDAMKVKEYDGERVYKLCVYKDTPLYKWLTGIFKKVCVYVESEEELLSIYNKAKEKGIICSLIQDSGITEFHGVPTYTCCAIGPDKSKTIDEITGDLKLL